MDFWQPNMHANGPNGSNDQHNSIIDKIHITFTKTVI